MIKVVTEFAKLQEDVLSYQSEVSRVHQVLREKTGQGNDYLGWLDWANTYDKEEFERIKICAKRIQDQADILLVCGIGGSYLGARAAIEFIQGVYPKRKLEVIYIGNTFSSNAIVRILDYIKGKRVALNVISKSGTTTETALAFRIFREYMETAYGEEGARERIYATTDKSSGLLRPLAEEKGYETFVIPGDIGGRFSVITPVGLLPIAAAGIDIDALFNGLSNATRDFSQEKLEDNPAYVYAVARRILEKQGKNVEMFVSYESQLTFLGEWLKQLYGESEGKDGKGILPASVNFSTDLHSMGQFIQDGTKCLFETVVTVDKAEDNMIFPKSQDDLDQMNYLAGKDLDWVNKQAFKGTLEAHVETGNVPNILIEIEDTSAYTFGYLVYFFFISLSMTCYMIDINPFNQPGVEVYKKNMFRLLGKK